MDETSSRLFVANYASSSVSVIDERNNSVIATVKQIPNISAPTGIAYGTTAPKITFSHQCQVLN